MCKLPILVLLAAFSAASLPAQGSWCEIDKSCNLLFDTTRGQITLGLEMGDIDNAGIAVSLLGKLSAAQNTQTACTAVHVLDAFENEVDAQTDVHIRPDLAEILRASAAAIRTIAPCL